MTVSDSANYSLGGTLGGLRTVVLGLGWSFGTRIKLESSKAATIQDEHKVSWRFASQSLQRESKDDPDEAGSLAWRTSNAARIAVLMRC